MDQERLDHRQARRAGVLIMKTILAIIVAILNGLSGG